MDGFNWVTIIIAILGSSVLASLTTGFFTYKKSNADTTKVLQSLWHDEIMKLRQDIRNIQDDLAKSEAFIDTLKAENKKLKED